MTPKRHREVSRHAGALLLSPLPAPGYVDELSVRASSGVYVMCSTTDDVAYVGKARRPSDPYGLVHRVWEHLQDGDRRLRWLRAWLIPMRPEAMTRQVELVEGMIGRDLGCPENKRLPRIVPVSHPVRRAVG